MKLSEMQVEEAFNKVVAITPYMTHVLKNEEVKKLMKKVEIGGDTKEEKENNGYNATIEKFTPLVNLIFKECRDDLYNVVAILIDKRVKEVKEMNILEFIAIVMDMIRDEALIKVFTQRIG